MRLARGAGGEQRHIMTGTAVRRCIEKMGSGWRGSGVPASPGWRGWTTGKSKQVAQEGWGGAACRPRRGTGRGRKRRSRRVRVCTHAARSWWMGALRRCLWAAHSGAAFLGLGRPGGCALAQAHTMKADSDFTMPGHGSPKFALVALTWQLALPWQAPFTTFQLAVELPPGQPAHVCNVGGWEGGCGRRQEGCGRAAGCRQTPQAQRWQRGPCHALAAAHARSCSPSATRHKARVQWQCQPTHHTRAG